MTARHKRVFAFAAVVAIGVAGGIAFARLQLIRWWLAHCTQDAPGCSLAENAFEWWWVLLLAALGAIALAAHWMTRDRLTPPA
jgi:H+/Cl- antiporter ClcA